MTLFPFANVATSYCPEAGFLAWKDIVAPLRSEKALFYPPCDKCIHWGIYLFTLSNRAIPPSVYSFSTAPGAVTPPIIVAAAYVPVGTFVSTAAASASTAVPIPARFAGCNSSALGSLATLRPKQRDRPGVLTVTSFPQGCHLTKKL
jgi:hypothetical protein